MICPKCGSEIKDSQNYCGICGTKISSKSNTNLSVTKKTQTKEDDIIIFKRCAGIVDIFFSFICTTSIAYDVAKNHYYLTLLLMVLFLYGGVITFKTCKSETKEDSRKACILFFITTILAGIISIFKDNGYTVISALSAIFCFVNYIDILSKNEFFSKEENKKHISSIVMVGIIVIIILFKVLVELIEY